MVLLVVDTQKLIMNHKIYEFGRIERNIKR